MKKLATVAVGVLAGTMSASALADVFVTVTVFKDKDKEVFEDLEKFKFVDINVDGDFVLEGAAEAEALANITNTDNAVDNSSDADSTRQATIADSVGEDSGVEAKDPPKNMLWGMGIAAFFCFFLGVYPEYLYKMLPFEVAYHPYTSYHFSETIQILGFTGLGFYLLRKKLTPEDKWNLDLDWFYRRSTPYFIVFASKVLSPINEWWSELYKVVGMRFALWAAAIWSLFDVKAIDGVVDGTDFIRWNENKFTEIQPFAVPEPHGALWVFVVVGIASFNRNTVQFCCLHSGNVILNEAKRSEGSSRMR